VDDARALWNAVAPAWDRNRARLFEQTIAISEWLIEQVRPGPDRTILETSAGAGETSFLAASHGGTVLCTDFASGMVEVARAEAERRGLTNVECRVMDAQRLELPDASVDGVMSRFGMMLVPDPRAAAAEAHRVLKPGAVFAYTVPAAPDRNPWAGLVGVAALQCGHALPPGDPFGPGGMFSLASEEKNRTMVEQAGFTDVATGTMSVPQRYEDFESYWRLRREASGMTQRLLAALEPDQIDAIHDTAEELAAGFRRPDGTFEFPSESVRVRAVR
jgi:SAM-dependent methyltransferase